MTADTVLEFDYETSGAQSYNTEQFQGIGVSNSLKTYLAKGFFLSGLSTASYPPEWTRQFAGYVAGSPKKHYVIPLGTYLAAGDYAYLVFVNNTNDPTDSISFSNIRIYDPVGASKTTLSYDESGHVKSTTDALGRATSNQYDNNGRLIRQTFADGTFITHEYDAAGNCIAVTDELGRTAEYVYDERNRLVQTVHPDGTSSSTRYDGEGRVVESTDELGHSTDFTYDKADRLLRTSQELTYAGAAAPPVVTANTYDRLGNLSQTVDPNGNVTAYIHDKLGRAVETRVLSKASPSGPPVSLTLTDYDANGQIATQAVADVPAMVQGNIAIPPIPVEQAYYFDANEFVSFFGAGPTTLDPSFPNGASVSDNDLTLSLQNVNARRAFPLNFGITADTVLEFDFKAVGSLGQSSLALAIGLAGAAGSDGKIHSAPISAFKLAGGQVVTTFPGWTNATPQYSNSGQWQHYSIPIGQGLSASQNRAIPVLAVYQQRSECNR